MTYNPNRPNASESPGVFPAQANTNFTRLKTIMNAEHVFNDTAGADDGVHRQMTMVARATPVSLPAGTNAIAYTKLDSGVAQLHYYNGTSDFQITPIDTVITGTVNVSASFATITAIPAEVFGEVFLWKGRFIQTGNFVSDATIVNGYSYAEKFESGSGASQILNLGFDAAGASGLNLRVANAGSSSFNGVWNYKVFYRSKT